MGRDAAEAEVLPDGVCGGQRTPEAADAGGGAEGTAVEALEDLDEDVRVVVNAERRPPLLFLVSRHLHLQLEQGREFTAVSKCTQRRQDKESYGDCEQCGSRD